MRNPVLCFDFDNTITEGDLLDQLVEKYSPDERWKAWEADWVRGALSARDCLKHQVEAMRVSRETLFTHLATIRIDPVFPRIVAWARARGVEVIIVSDSFGPIIDHVLQSNAVDGLPVYANTLAFAGERLWPAFPFHNPALRRSANEKTRHLAPYRGRTIVYAGDGRSDLDPALVSEVVFAKDTLAIELASRGVTFHPFATLEPVLAFLEASGIEPVS